VPDLLLFAREYKDVLLNILLLLKAGKPLISMVVFNSDILLMIVFSMIS